MSEAVITGVGAVSAFGVGAPTLWNALSEGRSAVGPIRSFDATTLDTQVAGEVPVIRPDPTWLRSHLHVDAAPTRRMSLGTWERNGLLRDRKVSFALLAAAEAWQRAGCGPAEQEASLSIGLGLEVAHLEDFAPMIHDGALRWSAEPEASTGEVRFRSPVDIAANLITESFGLDGAATLHVSACAAGALAVAHAASLVRRGAAAIVLCGAADSMVNPLGIGGLARLGVPSPRNEPDACRPFDGRRDGIAVGEGAAMFVVESEERARARGAPRLARVLGWGSTQDAYQVTAPRPDGSAARTAMERALRRARILPEAIGYVNAHGTGTPLNDIAEVRAIRGALGPHADHVPVSSIKGAVGHLMAAAGAVELAACLLAFERDRLPGTAHHRDRDPECDVDVIGPIPRAATVEHLLTNSFGFGGQNASVVLGRCR